MKLSKKFEISPEFEELFAFKDKNEELEHSKIILSLKFLHEIQTIIDAELLTKKEVAKKLEVSSSYITQLFRGDRLVNMTILAKMEEFFNFNFEIKAISNKEIEYEAKRIDFPNVLKKFDLNIEYCRDHIKGFKSEALKVKYINKGDNKVSKIV